MPIKCLKMGSGTTIVGWVKKDPAELLEPKPQADYSNDLDVVHIIKQDVSMTKRDYCLNIAKIVGTVILLALFISGLGVTLWAHYQPHY